MVDSPPQKNDEQYPLLKVETGGGDSGRPPAQPAAAPGWNVTCSSKRPWSERWPELISACWMTGMLLSIFIIIIYGLGTLGVIRKQPIIMTCNSSRTYNEVHFHHIVQHGERVSFSRFSEYLASMASRFSSLQFNVFFLIDDTMQYGYRGQRHSRLVNKLLPYHPTRDSGTCEGFSQRELKDFHKQYPNINITVMPLAKFMAKTHLRYKWKTIPLAYLSFYARVFSVWRYGGIGVDLETFNNMYTKHVIPDRRINAILKQYDKGSKPEEYMNAIKNIDQDDQNEFLKMICGLVYQFVNETRAFFNKSLAYKQDTSFEPITKTNRHKREALEVTQNTSQNVNMTIGTPKLVNNTDINIIDDPYENMDVVPTAKNTPTKDNVPFVGDIELKSLEADSERNKSAKDLPMPVRNASDFPQIILFYDVGFFADSMGPPYAFPEAVQANTHVQSDTENDAMNAVRTVKASNFLSLTLDGTFVAAISKQHPFLAHIISAGCQRMPPKFAIQDALMSQCSPIFNNDAYCSNIYVF